MSSKIREEYYNQKGKPVQRSYDGKENGIYEELKANSIAKQAQRKGWTNKGRLDHLGLIGNAEKCFFEFVFVCFLNPKSNEKPLKGFKQADRSRSGKVCTLFRGIFAVTADCRGKMCCCHYPCS